MASKHELLNLLSAHTGRDNGITVQALAQRLDTMPRNIRTLVSELRDEGIAVCAHPKTGYYIAQTAEELEQTCQFLRSRALHSLALEARLRRVPLPDLIGQLHLRT